MSHSEIKRNLWFTSDYHLDHEKALDLDERPFGNLREMWDTLINNYNNDVKHQDICYFLGDIAFKIRSLEWFVRSLNGTKILILGNHDKGPTPYLDSGFDAVMYKSVILLHGKEVSISHCPLWGVYRENIALFTKPSPSMNWHGDHKEKNRKFSFVDYGQAAHIHGHIHSRKGKPQSQRVEGKQFDVGVTANKYRPVPCKVIIKELKLW